MAVKAGVVFVSRFCVPSAKVFSNYINYMDRDEATRVENEYKFNLYNDYMGNPEKTSGLFTYDKDNLTQKEKKSLKDNFKTAQENGSIMWQHVISFDNEWLKDCGIINKETDQVNELRLKEATRAAMLQLQKDEGLENAIWSAAIHFNTDNVHIHIAMVEPVPMREMKNGERRGKLKLKSIQNVKSKVANNIFDRKQENILLSDIMTNVKATLQNHQLYDDKEFTELFMKVHSNLPEDKRQWNYNQNSIKDVRKDIDKMINIYLEKYQKEDYENFKTMSEKLQKSYRIDYGNSEKNTNRNYAVNKKKELYASLGNTILKQMKEFDKEEKQRIYKEAKASGRKLSQSEFSIYKGNKLRYANSKHGLQATVEMTKMFMKDECEKFRNQRDYEIMLNQIAQMNLEEEKEK